MCVLDRVEKKLKQFLVWYLLKKTDTWKTEKKECNIKMDIMEVSLDSVRWL
jgi:hypothetical protein